MTFDDNFARALLPVAIIAAAAPAAAADFARPRAAQGAPRRRPDDDREFRPDRCARPLAAGTLQLKRPGRVRFEYGSGDLLLVANGKTLTFIDYQVGQKIELAARQDAAGPAAVRLARLQRQGPDPAQHRSARRRRPRPRIPSQYGQLTLAFLRSASAPGGLQLYGWTAIDAQNHRTTVKLSNVRYNVAGAGQRLHLRRAEEAIG